MATSAHNENYFELPKEYSEVRIGSVAAANSWLKSACLMSIEARQALDSLNDVLETMPVSTKLSPHFKRFVKELKKNLKSLSIDSIMESVTNLDEWMIAAERLDSFRIKPPEPKSDRKDASEKSDDELEFELLEKMFSRFQSAFSGTPFMSALNEINDASVELQSCNFCKDLNIKKNKKPRPSVREAWRRFRKSLVALKSIMDRANEFEVEVNRTSSIRLSVGKSSEGLVQKNSLKEYSNPIIRVKLKVELQSNSRRSE
jgi:hypothetical protein